MLVGKQGAKSETTAQFATWLVKNPDSSDANDVLTRLLWSRECRIEFAHSRSGEKCEPEQVQDPAL
jgi:hypothetical protein